MNREVINTPAAPAAIGTYSQAVRVDNTIYISGQIPLQAQTMVIVEGEIEQRIAQVFENLQAICHAAGAELKHIVKLTIYLTDLSHFATVNEVMARYFQEPYPARAAVGVAQLPKGVDVEMDAIVCL